jgi:PAS domain S-box-containing protein
MSVPDLLFKKNPNPMWVCAKRDLRFLAVNDAAVKSYGYSRARFLAMSVRDIRAPSTRANARREYMAAAVGSFHRFRTLHRTRSGKEISVEVSVTPSFKWEGRSCFLAVLNDVTESERSRRVMLEEKENLKRYLDLAANIFLVIGTDGKTKHINRKGCEVFGLPESKIVGKDYFNLFIPKSERKMIRRLWGETVAGRNPISDYENVVVGARGPRRILWHSALLRDAKGVVTGTLSSGDDVTERRQTEAALSESRDRLEAFFNYAQEAIFLGDRRGRIVDVNPAACALLGLPRARLVGRHFLELTPGEDRAAARKRFLSRAGRKETGGDHRLLRSDGSVVDIEYRAVADIAPGLGMTVARDVTQRRAAERSIRENEEKYRQLVENWPEAVFMHSQGRFIYANPAAARLLQAPSPAEIIGRQVLDFVPPEGRGTVMARWKELRRGRPAPALEQRLITMKGVSIWAEVVGVNTTFLGKAAVQLLARDVTDRVAAREAFRESEERFRVLIEGVRDYAIFMLNPKGQVQSWNETARRMFGYQDDEVLGRSHKIFYAAAGAAERLRRKAQLEGRAEDEGWRRRKDGTSFLAHIIITALRRPDGSLRGFAVIVRDITELRKLERETMEFSAREQRRLGQDLHDGLGQHLTGLSLLAEALMGKLSERAPDIMGQAGRIASLAREAIDQTRALSAGLDPVESGPEGLAAAFQTLAANASMLLRIDCLFKAKGSAQVPDHAQAVQLYRIAQEAINNAVKHGKARRAVITLEVRDGSVKLAVRDDGVGMPQRPKPGGRGLQTMSYRARTMGGTLEIWNNEQGGATVSCSVPLQEAPVTAGRKEKR